MAQVGTPRGMVGVLDRVSGPPDTRDATALKWVLTALAPVIDEIREGAQFDARWEEVEKAFDAAGGESYIEHDMIDY